METNTCLSCYETCEICSGSAENECLSCKENYYFFENMCKNDCIDLIGYYSASDIGKCLACDENCYTCTGKSWD